MYRKIIQDLNKNFIKVYLSLVALELLTLFVTNYLGPISSLFGVRTRPIHNNLRVHEVYYNMVPLSNPTLLFSKLILSYAISIIVIYVVLEYIKSIRDNKKFEVTTVIKSFTTNFKYVANSANYLFFIISLYLAVLFIIISGMSIYAQLLILFGFFYLILRLSFYFPLFHFDNLNVHDSISLSKKVFDANPSKIFFTMIGMMLPFIIIKALVLFLMALKKHQQLVLNYENLLKYLYFLINPLFVMVVAVTIYNLYVVYGEKYKASLDNK